ncbi:Formate hydrogenlyase subunit 4(NADH:ubiquinone oxidoreductase, subunit 1/F420H2 oxidoreductase subunit H,4-312) [Magnetospirillum sp. XM-1]|uniref:respiratory chain complex I subunit 1 family protein n=1 Tax=Magnetospirillum sp. XM-1 TaxID=1663591 RepID=UPI00073E0876|nr:NADH-quinone oxidoreductase subunit H [Magnetospirillum sp. XM-1]CUW38221.1 Formate hydrogenlyase subunit 4(NADH:ubiquinone oxidoreductase, subunit 1/F420H2 oxidoreductase subunit H,4-312) [Magnetospirillum sp. XM-1]
MSSVAWQVLQIVLVVGISPLITGWVRLVKSRLNGRIGASPFQSYRDVYRLLQKEAVVAHSASWVFRAAPYVTFGSVWLAASIVPAFTTNLFLAQAADLIALVALLGVARFWTALAGMDIGTSFGGLGASREMMIASLAEPAMLMVTFSLSLVSGTTAPAQIIAFILSGGVGLEVSLGLALAALVMVAIAENGRIPIDNPATHLELTMVHEAMVLEYSGRHLALMEGAGMVRLTLFMALIGGLFAPWGMAQGGDGGLAVLVGLGAFLAKCFVLATALGVFETSIAKMRVFRYADFLGGALLLGLLATIFLYVSEAV